MNVLAACTAAVALIVPLQLPPLPPLPLPPLPPPPCLPPLPCAPNPLPPPPPAPPVPPPPADDPPKITLEIEHRSATRLTLEWQASDDIGLAGFRLYVDGWPVAQRGKDVRKASLKLRCKRHWYRVDAFDSALQRTSRSVSVSRRCGNTSPAS